ncbi:MAG TPA: thioredoxin family protein [Kiritimatiellia bacterium]|nr:thioredoxin family protein [Kiritimatiellia bacterium]HMP34222.1 thioredoxin family protein [Kiritimatiellia bacterium]
MKKAIATALIAALTGIGSYAEDLAIGAAAPEFTLTDTKGVSHNLSDFKGKFVVLEWVNHGCPFVVKHYSGGNMQGLQKEFTDKGVVWLSVCSSAEGKQGYMSNDEWNAAIAEKGIASTATLIDEDGTVGKLYNAKVTPHMYIINPEGNLIYQGAIDDKKSTDAEDIATSENYVRSALNAALAGEPVATSVTQPYGCSVKYK